MQFFFLLGAATVVTGLLTALLYRRTRDVSFVVGCAALYYWSLYGAWSVVIDKTGGYSGKNYQYLEYKLFPVNLDDTYLTVLVLYAAFIIVIQLVLLASLKKRSIRWMEPLRLRHEPILIISFTALALSVFLMKDQLATAWALNVSAYQYTRFTGDQFYTLHQVLNRLALIPSAIGFAILVAGERSRYFTNAGSRFCIPAYLFVWGAAALFAFVLGNKNEVLVALLCGLFTYLKVARKPSRLGTAFTLIAGLWFLYAIDVFRGTPLSELPGTISSRIENASQPAQFVTSSNEPYSAHFSLYGVLAYDVPPLFGYSFYSLACSVIPRILWPGRPSDIYWYYAAHVGAMEGQGYAIHHATAWYLNFGYPGVFLGALVFGLVWAYCYNSARRLRPGSGTLFRLFAILAPGLFVAYIPPFIRAGPENYKSLIVDAFLVPLLTLAAGCWEFRKRRAPERSVVLLAVDSVTERGLQSRS